MATDWNGFRAAAVKKYPQYAKQIDEFIGRKQTVDSVKSGKITLDQLPADQRATIAAQLPSDFEIQSKKQKESKEVKDEIKNKADALISILQAGKSGKLGGDSYKTALNAAASSLAASQGFGQGGKNLTGSELSILAGQMPRIEQSRQRLWDTIRGVQTPQTGNVVDNEDELMRKALILSKGIGSGGDISSITNSLPQDSQPLNGAGLIQNIINGTSQPESKFSLAGLLNNVVTNNKRVGEGAGKLGLDLAGASVENPVLGGLTMPFLGPLGLLLGSGERTDALRKDASAIPGGIVETIKQLVSDPAKFAYQNPTDVAMATVGGLPESKIKPNFRGLPEDIQGRAATSIATPDISNVTASENAMKNVLQMTKSNTVRGMAREIETFGKKANKFIDESIKPISQKIGNMNRDEIVDEVLNKISDSEVAKTNPELLNKIKVELEDKLNTGAIQNPDGSGNLFSTNLEKINEARKILNKQTSAWHESGKPLTTDASQYSALRYETSKALRDVLTNTSGLEELNDAIKLQHSAIEASPAIAKEALQGTKVSNSIPANLVQLFKTVTVPPRVALSRMFQGSGSDVIQKILGQ